MYTSTYSSSTAGTRNALLCNALRTTTTAVLPGTWYLVFASVYLLCIDIYKKWRGVLVHYEGKDSVEDEKPPASNSCPERWHGAELNTPSTLPMSLAKEDQESGTKSRDTCTATAVPQY